LQILPGRVNLLLSKHITRLRWLDLAGRTCAALAKCSRIKWLLMKFQKRDSKTATKTPPTTGKTKLPINTLHGRAVQVSVDERVSDLVRRYPALINAIGPVLLEGKKRIRDFPPEEQMRLLRMVYALKKAAKG
jgi:hypothetical protein